MLLISVKQLDGNAVLTEENHAVEKGYLCRFTSALGEGKALLVPGAVEAAALAGQEIMVSARVERISGLRPLPKGEPAAPRLAALDVPGNFTATGQVRSVVWLSDEAEDAIVEVQVGPLLFSVEAGEEGANLEYGEWVQVRLEQMTLYP